MNLRSKGNKLPKTPTKATAKPSPKVDLPKASPGPSRDARNRIRLFIHSI